MDEHCPTCGGPIGQDGKHTQPAEVLDMVRAVAERAAREEIAVKLGGDVIYERWQQAVKHADTLELALLAISQVGEQISLLARGAIETVAKKKP